MAAIDPPLVTCEPVLAEACFLIQRAGGKPGDLARKLVEGGIAIGMDLSQDAGGVHGLMMRYSDTPLSLADACLVRLSEKFPECRLFTLDSAFEHYRRNGRQVIPLLYPG
jgi:uncharacterized protein